MASEDYNLQWFKACVEELTGLREEHSSSGESVSPLLRLRVRDLVNSVRTSVDHRKNYPTLVARIPNELMAWVASLGPCEDLLTQHARTYSGLPCKSDYIRLLSREESLNIAGVCHDFDLARPAAIAFCSKLGTGSLRQMILEHLLNPSDYDEGALTTRERGILRLAQRLFENTPATQAAMLATLVDDRTDADVAEQALRVAIATDAADDSAYWNLAQLCVNRHDYTSAIALVDAGMLRVTSVSEMRRMQKKSEKWARL